MNPLNLLVFDPLGIGGAPLSTMLDQWGYHTVKRVRYLAEARKILETSPPDLLLIASLASHIAENHDLVQYGHHRLIPVVFLLLDHVGEGWPNCYLAKPLEQNSLHNLSFSSLQAMSKGLNLYQEKPNSNNDFLLNNSYFIKTNNRIFKVPIQEVTYIKSMGNYCSFQTSTDRFMVRQALTRLEKMLPAGQFARAHKSYIVRLEAIEEIFQSEASLMISGEAIPIGRKFKANLFERLNFLT